MENPSCIILLKGYILDGTGSPHHLSTSLVALVALEHRSLIGANNFGWCFEYDGFDADDTWWCWWPGTYE